jgi:lysine 6-dehydrogenase
MSPFRYVVIGAGRQGTAAAHDLIMRGQAESVVMADRDTTAARAAAERVNELTGAPFATWAAVDAGDRWAVSELLGPAHAALGAASYRLNVGLSEAAVEAGTHLCDLGGHIGVVRRQLELDAAAARAGVCLVPDCGEAPGLVNNLAARACRLLDRARDLAIYDGGLPVEPRPPWNYALTFSVDGLTNEYDGTTTYVRDGRPVEVACLDPAEDEIVDFGPPFGTLEAFAAATASTLPSTLGRGLRSLTSKVLRYPGHAAQFRAFRDLGLFSEEPVTVGDSFVVPRDVFHALLQPRIRAPVGEPDVVLARLVARGERGGRPARAVVTLRVDSDGRTGLTAMQRATGEHAAIVMHLAAAGRIRPGATPVELAVEPEMMVEEIRRRGFQVEETVEALGSS